MKGDASAYELFAPKHLDEALSALAADAGSLRAIAGGTDLMVLFAGGRLAAGKYLDLWGVDELRGITLAEDAVTLGALTTYTEVQSHPLLCAEFPMMCQAASETGGLAIQNRGTLGGNIANASPAADSPPAMLAYGASLELASSRGVRWVPYRSFHTGYKQTLRAPDELVTRIRIPRVSGSRTHFYRKVGPRKAQAISKVCFAASIDHVGSKITRAGIAVGGVAPVVLTCVKTESALVSGADAETILATLSAEVTPIDDVRSTARYRRKVAVNLLGELLSMLAKVG